MKRDDLLHTWFKLFSHSRFTNTWHDIGAGDGSVSRALKKIRPNSEYTCWDPKPQHREVKKLETGLFPLQPVDFVLFNFVLHHLKYESLVDCYLRSSLPICRKTIVFQEDLDDGTAETRRKLEAHEPMGYFLGEREWVKKIKELCPGKPIHVIPHPEDSDDIQGYQVPRALFIVECNL